MKKVEKVNYFKTEISYVKNEEKRKDLITLIELLPDYFFEIAASSSGKYHPKFAGGRYGLLKHTKVAVRIAYELIENEVITDKFTDDEKDLIIMALVLHDGLKLGKDRDKYTKFDHPLLISKFIMENKDKLNSSIDDIRKLCLIIESHMGKWTIDPYTQNEVLPKPISEIQKFVHMCDYLSSRKFLDVEFNGYNIRY